MTDYIIRVGKPNVTEEDAQAMYNAVKGNFLGPGPYVEKFEEGFAKYLGVKNAIAVNSGTSAMLLPLAASGIQSGDEVITTTFTFAATSNVILLNNAKPIFVDIEFDTYNLDPKKIERAITPKTKAIMPIDYGGQSAETIEIKEIAEKNNLIVIEDAAPAFGGEHKNQKIGSVSNISGFSFGPDKNLNTGEGGMIVTNDTEIAEKCKILRKNGAEKRYFHTYIGWNAKMPDPNAALGTSQLNRIDSIVATKNNIAKYYSDNLEQISSIEIPKVKEYNKHTFMLYSILAKTNKIREKIRTNLEKNKIETRVNFPPVHLQPIYKKLLGSQEGICPIAEDVANRVLGLPMFLTITEEEQDLIIKTIKEAIK